MTTEDLLRFVSQLSRATVGYETLAWTVNAKMKEADELLSIAGTGVGVRASYVDLTKDRDLYPLPPGLVRPVSAERLDQGQYTDLQLVPQALVRQGVRMRGGAYASIVGENLRIYPVPTVDAERGLRIWGYYAHAVQIGGSAEAPVVFPAHAEQYVILATAAALAEDQATQRRLEAQVGQAKLTFLKLVEAPHSGVGAQIIREVP
jgi:hypothetical protein